MDKLIAIRIKQDDSTYSEAIPVSVLSEYVEWDDDHSLVDIIGNVDTTNPTYSLQDQITQLWNQKASVAQFDSYSNQITKLWNQKVDNTQLSNYVDTQLKNDVKEWLDENVTPVGSAVIVDSSLTQSGAAADAKVTGDAIVNLKNNLFSTLFDEPIATTWSFGLPVALTGEISTGNGAYSDFITNINTISLGSNCKAVLCFWNNTTYLGRLNSTGGCTKSGTWGYVEGTINISAYLTEFNATKFKIGITPTDGIVITEEVVQTYGDNHCVISNSKIPVMEKSIKDFEDNIDIITDFIAFPVTPPSWSKTIINAINSGTTAGNGATCSIMYADSITIADGCRAVMRLFNNSTYLGKLTTLPIGIDKATGNWKYFTGNVNVASIMDQFGANLFQITLLPIDSTVIEAETVATYGNEHCSMSILNFANKEKTKSAVNRLEADTFLLSINHRGYSIEAPENTIPAYILSKKYGFQYAECDVEFTSDNIPVLLHDSTINRTARNSDGTEISSTINIGSITYEQASQYDFGIWKGEQWAGTKIPTLEEYLVVCKKLSLNPVIELKDTVGGSYWTDARISTVAEIIKDVAMQNYVSFISFSRSALEKINVHFPDAMIGLGLEGSYATNFNTFITNLIALKNVADKVIATVSNPAMTDAYFKMLTSNGILPVVFTVNTYSAIESLHKSVYGVLSDNYNAGGYLMNKMMDSIN